MLHEFFKNLLSLSIREKLVLKKNREVGHYKDYQITTFRSNLTILKALDTVGNCLRPVFSLGVSQHMHEITNRTQLVIEVARE